MVSGAEWIANPLLGRIHVRMGPIVEGPNDPGQQAQSDEYFRNIRSPIGNLPIQIIGPFAGKWNPLPRFRASAGAGLLSDRTPAPTPAYRRTLSFALAEVSQVAFLADLLQHLIGGGGGRACRCEIPDAVLFRQRTVPRTGRRVIRSPALSISRASPGSKCSSFRRGRGITTRPALSNDEAVFTFSRAANVLLTNLRLLSALCASRNSPNAPRKSAACAAPTLP